MKDRLEIIVNHLNTNNLNWFVENGIIVKEKGKYWVLNYHQFADKNEFNVLTRGLVVSKSKGICSFPFTRFFNYGEPCAAKVDFLNSDLLEKFDGSLLVVCFPEGKPVWHFRNLISDYDLDKNFTIKPFLSDDRYSLIKEVEPYLNQIQFNKDLYNYSIIFEFVSKSNPIITKYESHQYGLYLIGARYLPTLHELSEDSLDELAKYLEVRRPRRWNACSYDEIIAMMGDFPKDYEGFVVRDRITGERIKIKSEDYLIRHRLLDKISFKKLIPLYFLGERDEIESKLPQSKQIFNNIEKHYNEFVEQVLKTLLYWQDKNCSRKEVALGIVGKEPKQICAVVFKLLDVKENQRLAVQEFVRTIRPETLIESWNLKDEEAIVI